MEFYLGTWQVAPSDGFWTGQDIEQSEKVISAAVRLGIRGFDTAQSYGRGRSEQTLSKVLRRFAGVARSCSPTRPDSLTKPTNLTSAGSPTSLIKPTNLTSLIRPTNLTSLTKTFQIDTKIMPSSRDVSEIVRISRSRLAPFGIDCLYLHWPGRGFDNVRFIRQMEALREAGTIGKTGVCNVGPEELTDMVRQDVVPDRVQIPISLLWTRDLETMLSICRENGIRVVAYSPSGMGLLSGKYRRSSDLHDARARIFCFDDRCRRQYLELLDVIGVIAGKHNVSCTGTALSWVCAKKPDIVLLGARSQDQLKDNLSDPVELSPSETADLDDAARNLDRAAADVCDNIFSYRW